MGNAPCSQCLQGFRRRDAAPRKTFKVCICGGAGAIGQQLALLLALEPLVSELSVYDMEGSQVPVAGVAADLQHLEVPCKVKSYSLGAQSRPVTDLPAECLQGCSLVLVAAGIPRRAGQDKAEWAKLNANITKLIVEACVSRCPRAVVGLMVEPLTVVVPAMAQLYERKGLEPTRILGITGLHSMRATRLAREALGSAAKDLRVPVVGGHVGKAIVPLFSQAPPAADLALLARIDLEAEVQNAGAKVIQAKANRGSSTLSAAYAAAQFAKAVLQGLSGRQATEYAFLKSKASELPFFASQVTFGPTGVRKVIALPKRLDEYERGRIAEAVALLRPDLELANEYAKANRLA